MKMQNIGAGWYATANDDDSFTLRNPDKGQRIDLSSTSAALFVRLWDECDAARAEAKIQAEEVK